jgi:hypothetical protein
LVLVKRCGEIHNLFDFLFLGQGHAHSEMNLSISVLATEVRNWFPTFSSDSPEVKFGHSFEETMFIFKSFSSFDSGLNEDPVIGLRVEFCASRFELVDCLSGRCSECLGSVKDLESFSRFLFVVAVEVELYGRFLGFV